MHMYPYLVAIGSSTGGVKVLQEILKELPTGKGAAILIAHHITRDFEKDFFQWISRQTPYAIKTPKDGERICPDTIYVAPSDVHLCVGADGIIRLSKEPPVDGFRPSATKLFESVAKHSDSKCIGIVLSGMGRDGAAGLLEMAKIGGVTIAQDKKTSPVFGMPDVAIKMGAVSHILGSGEIAKMVLQKLEAWNR